MASIRQLTLASILAGSIVFSCAFLVRTFVRQDTFFEAPKVQPVVVELYRIKARILSQEGIAGWFDPTSKMADLDLMGHPPGYSFLLSIIFNIWGESNFAIQLFSITVDGVSAVLVLAIGCLLFSRAVGIIAGLAYAFSPQFAYNSVLYLPDTLAVFPLLAALIFFIYAVRTKKLGFFICCGICLALSCWLRANTLLLPLFFGAATVLLSEGKRKYVSAAALIAAFVVCISPITIRNAVVYRTFIPISLGAGQTLLEGIGDYDKTGWTGFPKMDVDLQRLEAEQFERPDYATTLFGPDGIKRDRRRVREGLSFIGQNPIWFGSVMIRRAADMTRLERVVRVSTTVPPVSIGSRESNRVWPAADQNPQQWNVELPQAQLTRSPLGLELITDREKGKLQLSTERIPVFGGTEYSVRTILHIPKGRVSIRVSDANSGAEYSKAFDGFELGDDPGALPEKTIQLPFVPEKDTEILISIYNESDEGSAISILEASLSDFGPSNYLWTKPIRWVTQTVQRLFTTNVFLPLVLIGIALMCKRKEWASITILAIVPIYYFTVQSALHTEYRYVMALHCSSFLFAAYAICSVVKALKDRYTNPAQKGEG